MKKDMFYVINAGYAGYDYKELCEIINKKDYGYIGEFETKDKATEMINYYREEIIYPDEIMYLVYDNTYIEC